MENMKIRNFEYNGFIGELLEGYANYTANFEKWTNDPGIAVCKCSDGKTRLIPSYAMENLNDDLFPTQKYDSCGATIYGVPCKS